jgi:hypothetical protein
VIATPSAGACPCEDQDGSGAVGGATPSPASPLTSGFAYPKTSGDFDSPPLQATGQFYSSGGSGWAVPGLIVWVAPFGNVSITGASGDLVTYKNLTIPQGTTIRAGTFLVPDLPRDAADDPAESSVLDFISGFVGGVPKQMTAPTGSVMRHGQTQWQGQAAHVFFPKSDRTLLLEAYNRVTLNATTGSGSWTSPTTPVGGNPASFTFPALPADFDLTRYALLEVEMGLTPYHDQSPFLLSVTINNIAMKMKGHSRGVLVGSTNGGLTWIEPRRQVRVEHMLVPVPDNGLVAVAYEAKRYTTLTTGNTDYLDWYVKVNLLGYYA